MKRKKKSSGKISFWGKMCSTARMKHGWTWLCKSNFLTYSQFVTMFVLAKKAGNHLQILIKFKIKNIFFVFQQKEAAGDHQNMICFHDSQQKRLAFLQLFPLHLFKLISFSKAHNSWLQKIVLNLFLILVWTVPSVKHAVAQIR